MIKNNFTRALLKAVDQGLLMLGQASRKAIYFHLKRSFQLEKRDVPKRIDEFEHALSQIFGPGANFIEKCIVKDLYHKLGLSYKEDEDFVFAGLIREAQRLCHQKVTQVSILDLKQLGGSES